MKATAVLCFLLAIPLGAEELPADARKAWGKAGKTVEDILELEDLRPGLPESRLFGRDQKDLDEDIAVLLDDVTVALRISGLSTAREGYVELEEREAQRREELRKIREKVALAPKDVSVLEFYRKDRAALQAEADAVEQEIDNIQQLKEELVKDMVKTAQTAGVKVDREQMQFLLSSVSGSDLLDLGAVFQNVRDLHGMLEGLVRENPEDPQIARRYYGMHVVLLRALVGAHDEVVARIDDRYLPRIDELEEENTALQKETDRLIRFAEEAQLEILRSSQDTQRVTAEALDLYHEHLEGVRDRVYETRKELQQRVDVAWNAYQTIRIAATLAEEMTQAVQDLQTLRSLDVPDLVPLQDEAIQQKFRELSEQLKE